LELARSTLLVHNRVRLGVNDIARADRALKGIVGKRLSYQTPTHCSGPMGKAGEKQMKKAKIKDQRQSERLKETARQVGADQPSDALDKIIGEMGRNLAFPPCPSCGKAMGLVQVMPADDTGHEERLFKCSGCGTMESKILNED
jgi:hypothetical protein